MKNYLENLPRSTEKYVGKDDLYLQIYQGRERKEIQKRPPLLFIHGAFSGSWMWCKYISHFVDNGWDCYVMNLRSHYKSRVQDLSVVTFEDYIEDVEVILEEMTETPILIGFSMGGIICQKISENKKIAGMILIDSTINKEVANLVPFQLITKNNLAIIEPAPVRNETKTIDETADDIAFQKRYYQMESAKVFEQIGTWLAGVEGISIDNQRLHCPVLVIKSINSQEKDERGRAEAAYLNAEYLGLNETTHTGLLMGIRYEEVVNKLLSWLKSSYLDI